MTPTFTLHLAFALAAFVASAPLAQEPPPAPAATESAPARQGDAPTQIGRAHV